MYLEALISPNFYPTCATCWLLMSTLAVGNTPREWTWLLEPSCKCSVMKMMFNCRNSKLYKTLCSNVPSGCSWASWSTDSGNMCSSGTFRGSRKCYKNLRNSWCNMCPQSTKRSSTTSGTSPYFLSTTSPFYFTTPPNNSLKSSLTCFCLTVKKSFIHSSYACSNSTKTLFCHLSRRVNLWTILRNKWSMKLLKGYKKINWPLISFRTFKSTF